MARSRRAALRRLTVEQETVLSSWGNLLSGEPGESDLDTAVRLFGSAEAASAAWYGHRDTLLAADPVPARRPAGYWLFERGIDPPRVGEEEAELRQLGELTVAEETQLEEWRRMVPEPPDLSIDHQSTTAANLEEAIVDATSAAARPEATLIEAGLGAGTATNEDPPAEASDGNPPEPERVEESAVRKPQILIPWPLQNGRNPNEGWL